ncbi:MAG: D-alanine--D-alanine ligase [Ignavibacterium sp.]
MNSKINVALIVGGASSEREVSKLSGKEIYDALKKLGYSYKIIDPAYGINQQKKEEYFFSAQNYFPVSERNYLTAIDSNLFDDVDVAFLALHGKWGEDGTIQSLLKMRGIKFTGSDVLPSSLSMNKWMSKVIFKQNDIKVPDGFLIKKNKYVINDLIIKIKNSFKFPVVVKPNDEGSTFGLSVCQNENDFEKALDFSFQYSNNTLIEKYISGREITVGILEQTVLPVLEIKPKHNLYDYECKYTHGMSEYIVPANIPKNIFEAIQKKALVAFNSLGCKSYARVDFRLDENNNFYCLELNTLPGMTSTSLLPKMAKATGISYENLVDKIIKIAIDE